MTEICETCVVEIRPDPSNTNQKLIIYGVYRPPNYSLPNFIEYIEPILIELSNSTVACVGDFNVDIINQDVSADFVNVMFSYNLYPLVNIPTRVTEESAKCLDHIWYNKFDVSHSGAFVTDFSDHYLIFCILNISINRSPIIQQFRDHSEANLQNLTAKLISLMENYTVDVAAYDLNRKTEYFVNCLFLMYNESVSYTHLTLPTKRIV